MGVNTLILLCLYRRQYQTHKTVELNLYYTVYILLFTHTTYMYITRVSYIYHKQKKEEQKKLNIIIASENSSIKASTSILFDKNTNNEECLPVY